MKYYFSKYLIISIAIVTGFCFLPVVANAFSVSESTIEHVIEPGKKVSGSFSVKNETDTPATFDVTIGGVQQSGEIGELIFFKSNDSFLESSWVVPQEKKLILQPHEVRDFNYEISVPSNAISGGHYLSMLFSRTSSDAKARVQTSGVPFYIRVPGSVHEEIKVLSFSTKPADSFRRLPISFETRIQNLGNVHVKPKGSIVVKNMFGKEVVAVPLNPDNFIILPNSTRRFQSIWTKTGDPAQEGDLSMIASLKNEVRNFAFGRYTAEIRAEYGDGEQKITAKTTFWVVPRSLILAILAIILILVVASRVYSRYLIGSYIRKLNSR